MPTISTCNVSSTFVTAGVYALKVQRRRDNCRAENHGAHDQLAAVWRLQRRISPPNAHVELAGD